MRRPLNTYEIEGPILIKELVKHFELPLTGCDIDLMEIPSRTGMELHHHKTFDEVFYVVDGSGVREDETGEIGIEKGDVFVATRGSWHAVFTKEFPLSVLTICLPHFDLNDIYYKDL